MSKLLAVLMGAWLLAGCGAGSESLRSSAASAVEIRALPGANDGNPVAVDVVVIYRDELAGQVAALSASQWFERRPQWLVQAGDTMNAFSFEVAPGELLKGPQAIVFSRDAVAVYVFANYYNADASHRVRATPGRVLIIELGERGFRVSER